MILRYYQGSRGILVNASYYNNPDIYCLASLLTSLAIRYTIVITSTIISIQKKLI